MAKKTPTSEPDIDPEPIDDTEEIAEVPPRPETEDDETVVVAPTVYDDDRREAIANRYHDIRDGKVEEEEEEDLEDGDIDEAEEEEDLAASQDDDVEDDPYLELKVDRKATPMKASEVDTLLEEQGYDIEGLDRAQKIKFAQIEISAKNRLEDANRTLEETKALKAQFEANPPAAEPANPQDQPTRQPEPNDPDPEPTPALDDDKLNDIVERITIGEPDEQRAALKEYGDALLAQVRQSDPTLSEEKVGELVEQRLVQHQQKSESDRALEKFRAENADLLDNELLAQAGTTAISTEMISDLRNVGVPDDRLAEIRGNPEAVSALHRQVRAKGYNVRSLDEVFSAGATALRETFGLKKPDAADPDIENERDPTPAVPVERANRKRKAQQQPRASGGRDPARQPKGKLKPQSVADIVREERKARHFPVSS